MAIFNTALCVVAQDPDPEPFEGEELIDEVIAPCFNGGHGSSSCNNLARIMIDESGVGAECSVTCGPGYYA